MASTAMTFQTDQFDVRSHQRLATFLETMPKGKTAITKAVRSVRTAPYLWDPWILQDDGIYRLFYLATLKPHPSVPFWSQGTIAGAVSTDMKRWQSIGAMLKPNPANDWEAGRMLAGSIYKEDGTYYLFYSATGKGEMLGEERIGLATSSDGFNWRRQSNAPLFSLDDCSFWYGKARMLDRKLHFHFRDPYIFKDPQNGKYYLFICTYLEQEVLQSYSACVGLAVADQITGPYQLLPPVAAPTVRQGWSFAEMERPQIIYKYGKYHLFFSSWHWNLPPEFIQKLDRRKVKPSSLYWFTSNQVAGPFEPASSTPVVEGSEKTGIYGTNFFPDPERPDELIACGWYHRLHTLQVSPHFKVHWTPDSLEIRRS